MNNVALSLEDRKQFALQYLKDTLKAICPKDTFNLTIAGIVVVDDEYVGIGNENAEYAIYTNESWKDKRWKGKTNPNEGWVQRGIESALPYIKQIMSGELTKDDIEQSINNLEEDLQKQMNDAAAQYEKELLEYEH